ncbi:DNA-binding protein [Thermococcus celericrescens]|uniref:DNA-binding protein n=1 Tax=Thermococcus celericrescens TaxID=227598 RepID=A0A100XZK9_9EURY|nr:helix-turn-helix domain-containing protein [Thermococcus celericrescens]KUH34559.1 DNA-binding protein [Thermococcus celericrescens]
MRRWMRCDPSNMRAFTAMLKSLISEPRRSIIRVLADGVKGTNEIYIELQRSGFHMPRSTLYYHLSALQKAGIIEMVGYREQGGGAPEKLWKLKVRRIGVDLVTGDVFRE